MLYAGEVNYLTQFCQEYQALKASENWQGIIDLGLKALGNSRMIEKNSALIQNRLASCYYYLGDHDEALKYANNAYKSAVQANDNGLKARSLYLSSAIYRMLALKTAGKKRKKYEDCSQVNINAALKLLRDHSDISNVVKAKVYFNDGALKHDLMKDFDAAIERYSQAEELFKKEELCDDDINRTIMRRIRADVESGKKIQPDKLISEVQALNIDKETKTGVHQSLLLSKLLIECEKIYEALICAKESLEVAKNKSMSTEVRMLNKVIYSIEGGYCKTVNQQYSSEAEKAVITQQPQSFLSEAERVLDQAINQDQEVAKNKSMSTEVRMLNKVIYSIEGDYCKTVNQQYSSEAKRAVITQQPQSFLSEAERVLDQAINQDQEVAKNKSMSTEVRMLNKVIYSIEGDYCKTVNQQYSSEAKRAVITQQPQSFLSEAERMLDQAINQDQNEAQQPTSSSATQRESYPAVPGSLWTVSEIGQWQEQAQAMNQQQPILFNESEWQTMPQQQSIFLNPLNLGLYQAGVLQSPVIFNSPDIEPYQTGALQQLVLFAESEIERDQTVNQGESIFFTREVVPQQPPIFFNESERRQDQVIAQQPQSSLHEPEVNIVIDRQYYK